MFELISIFQTTRLKSREHQTHIGGVPGVRKIDLKHQNEAPKIIHSTLIWNAIFYTKSLPNTHLFRRHWNFNSGYSFSNHKKMLIFNDSHLLSSLKKKNFKNLSNCGGYLIDSLCFRKSNWWLNEKLLQNYSSRNSFE